MTDLSNPIYHNEEAARIHLEKIRWPDGPVCPCCGLEDKVKTLGGKSMGPGWYHCTQCREKFTVRMGTVYERSHVKLHKWVLATHLMCASKKGMSAHQLSRMLKVTYKTAWFMSHRIREAMRDDVLPPIGGPGKTVQADETYFGIKDHLRGKSWDEKRGHSNKMSVVGLVSEGKARMFHVDNANADTVRHILVTNVSRETELYTDESRLYHKAGEEFADHRRVNHSKGEYVRGPVTTNNIENYFSVFKRGMKGVYQHCSEKHLQRYLNEFDFRYNNRDMDDFERSLEAMKGAEGKRITYRRTAKAA